MEFMKVSLNLNFFHKTLGDKNKRTFLKPVLGNFDNHKKMWDYRNRSNSKMSLILLDCVDTGS